MVCFVVSAGIVELVTELLFRLSKKTKDWKEESETSSKDDLLDDEKMSARALIHNASQNITEPREYQLELFEIAKQMNCLAVLDTGTYPWFFFSIQN